MKFKLKGTTIELDDKELSYLSDIGLEFDLDLTLEQICTIAQADDEFLHEAFRWGLGDTGVDEAFMNAICKFFIKRNYPSYPATDFEQDQVRIKVKQDAIKKGFSVTK